MADNKQDILYFFEKIKKSCIEVSLKYNIIPSFTAAIAAISSEDGKSHFFRNTKNLFGLYSDDEWQEKVYSKNTNTVYKNRFTVDKTAPILYKVYNSIDDSIVDWNKYLLNKRRSTNGPYKYIEALKYKDYKELLYALNRVGFIEDYFGNINSTTVLDNIINMIESYKLNEWDNEVNEMSKKKKKISISVNNDSIDNDIIDEESELEESEEVSIMENKIYRVRLEWDRPTTQIFASENYDLAKEYALKHEGYKIFVGDDGELFEDPWEKKDPKPVDTTPKTVIIPTPGKRIILSNTAVYRSASDKLPFKYMNGQFYFYDSIIINKRARITVHDTTSKRNPLMILGYINIED